MIADPLSAVDADVRVMIIQGEKHPTPTWIARNGGQLATSGANAGGRPALAFLDSDGDTLVPSQVTYERGNVRLRDNTLRLKGKVKPHAVLCDGKFVAKRIARFLVTAVVLVFSAALASAPVVGQQYRAQVGATGALANGHALVGIDFAHPLGGGACKVGGVACASPGLAWSLGAFGGLVQESLPLTIFLQTGVESTVNEKVAIALLVYGQANPGQTGLAGRFDFLDVAAAKIGHGWGVDSGWMVAIEVALEFLLDLTR